MPRLFAVLFAVCALAAAEAETKQIASPAAAFPWTKSTNLLQAAPASAAATPATPAAPAKPFFDPFFFGMYYPFMWMYYMPWMWMSWTMPFMGMWW